MIRRLWSRLGLRARITGLYALGGLLLSLTIALSTLTLARQNLIEDREERAFSVAVRNAQRVENGLGAETEIEDVGVLLDNLTITEGSFPLLQVGDATRALDQAFDADAVPSSLRELVEAGNAGRMRVRVNGRPLIVTGIPIPDTAAAYYEAAATDDVEDVLNTLGIIVLGVGAAAILLSAALGSWASRRALTPLGEVRLAAESLAAGELDTRLDPPADADLASLTASFNGMARSLEDRIERDARFASEVSHELRSPLMTLNASVEVLNNNRDSMTERNQTALDLLTDDVTRFTALVEDLLEISRYDVGTASLRAEPIDLVEFVRQSVDHSPYDVVIDVGALQYLAVEDEGPGVPEAERSVIFDRFSRGSAGGRRGHGTGSGLGLALVAEHVGLHGGDVWVDDRLDGSKGARFTVRIPIGDIPDDEEWA